MDKSNYNPWPLGEIPKELQRPELEAIKKAGYKFEDAREVLHLFENKVAEFTGAKYAVAVDCCTHALELSLRYLQRIGELDRRPMENEIIIPAHTYVSVALMIKKLGFNLGFDNISWSGAYKLQGTRVIDGAVRWKKNMYIANSLQCLSFQIKKRIPIGRGGMILTDDEAAYNWLRFARYDGRDMSLPYDHPEHIQSMGYHYYMTPEDAARGILLMDQIGELKEDYGDHTKYPNVEKMIANI